MKKILASFLSVLMVLTCIIIPGMVVSAATPEYLDHYNFSVKEGKIFDYAVGAYSTKAGLVSFATGDDRADREFYPFYTANAIKNGSTTDEIGYELLTAGEDTYDSIGVKFRNPTCFVPMMADGKPFELKPDTTYTVDISYAVTANNRTKNDSYFCAAGGLMFPYFTNAEYITSTVPAWDDVELGRVFTSANTVIPKSASVTGELETATLTFTTKPAASDDSYSYNEEENVYTVTADDGSGNLSSVDLYNYFQIHLFSYGTVEINFTHIEITSEDYVPQTTVEYVVDGEVVKSETVEQGTDYAINYIQPHTSEKRFAGWYYDEELTNKVKHNTASVSTDGIETLRLYAKMVEYETNITMPVNSGSWGTALYPEINANGAYIINMNTKRSGSSAWAVADADKLSIVSNASNQFLLVASNPENDDLLVAKSGAEYKLTLKYKVNKVPETGNFRMVAGYDIEEGSAIAASKTFVYSSSDGLVADNNVSSEIKELTQNIVIGERSGGYPFLGFRVLVAKDFEVEFYELKVEEVISEDISTGEFLVTDSAENRTTYKVEFAYKLNEELTEDIGIGFKTIAENDLGYPTFVEGENVAIYNISADKEAGEWIPATAFVTTDMTADVVVNEGTDDDLTALNSKLYAYIIGEDNYSKISVKDVVATELGDVVGKGKEYYLTGEAEIVSGGQALRYSFTYESTTGSDIIIGGETYTVKSRGFIYLNGKGYALDGRYAGDINLTNAKAKDQIAYDEKSTELEKCWLYEGTTLHYSTYVYGFDANDTKELMVRGYVVVECDGQTFTLYSDTFNRSVAYMKSR